MILANRATRVCDKAVSAIRSGDIIKLGDLMNENHMLLKDQEFLMTRSMISSDFAWTMEPLEPVNRRSGAGVWLRYCPTKIRPASFVKWARKASDNTSP